MKVVKRNVSKVNVLRDFFVKQLSVEPTMMDIVKEGKSEDGTIFRVNCEIINDVINIVISSWNEKTGVDLGIREYVINLFPNENKVKVRLPHETVGLAIIEALENEGIGCIEFGSGYSCDWIMNDDETKMSKIWFSNDFKYFSITTKDIEPKEETVSKEDLLDRLGL